MNLSRRRNPYLVYEVLSESDRPLTAYQILDRVKPLGLSGPPTVYRALEVLQHEGLVHRLHSINAFTVCHSDARKNGTSFMICHACGVAEEVYDQRIEVILDELRTRARFSMDSHTIELSGTCEKCKAPSQ